MQSDIGRVRDKLDVLDHDRNEDRIRRAEELSQLRVSLTTNESRIRTLEEGVGRLITHSTWLVRLIIGGLLAGILQFAIKGGLIGAL
jgi:hypothetical protein